MISNNEVVLESVAGQASTRGAPAWALQPFKDLVDQTERQGQLLHLSMKGISVLRGVPRIVEVLAEVEDTKEETETREKIEQARREADLAHREIKEGFPLLHAYAALALWSSLEAAVRSFLVRWLQHSTGALEIDAVQKLKVRIGEYESLQGEDRFFYILDRLEQELSAPLRSGVTRFEAILEPFGLSGNVDNNVQRQLFELNQIRNVLMHRGGKADRRLIEACPWLSFVTGQQVVVDHSAIGRYTESVMRYATELIARIGEYFGVDMGDVRQGNGSNRLLHLPGAVPTSQSS